MLEQSAVKQRGADRELIRHSHRIAALVLRKASVWIPVGNYHSWRASLSITYLRGQASGRGRSLVPGAHPSRILLHRCRPFLLPAAYVCRCAFPFISRNLFKRTERQRSRPFLARAVTKKCASPSFRHRAGIRCPRRDLGIAAFCSSSRRRFADSRSLRIRAATVNSLSLSPSFSRLAPGPKFSDLPSECAHINIIN